MATTQNVTTTYAGESAGKFVSAALLESASLTNGAIEVRPNVKYKEVLHRLDVSSLLADATCDFTATGTVTLAERVLTPKELQVNIQLCKANYRNTWQAIEMGYSAHDNLAPSFADYLLEQVVAKVASVNEVSIWSGDSSNSGEFDGFETLLAADTGLVAAQELAGTTVTAANVIAEIQSVLDATPTAVYKREGFFIGIPVGIEKHYIAAQAALGYRDLYHDGKTNLNFQGVPLIVCPGMTDDVMIATYKENLYFGTGLLSDQNEAKVLDQSMIDGSDNVNIVMRFTAGVQYAAVEDIVTYGISNIVN